MQTKTFFQSQANAIERRDSTSSSLKDSEIEIGMLNSGDRIDYQVHFPTNISNF